MKPKTAEFILCKILGWKMGPFCQDPKALILGVPHTTVWDFPIAALYAIACGKQAHILVKQSFFFWPVGPIIKKLGAIPLEETTRGGAGAVRQMIDAYRNNDEFLWSFAPEGTRSPVKHWKTGFHKIAREAGVPVYAGYYDWGTKTVTCGGKFELTDDLRSDMIRLQQHYKDLGIKGFHPEKFVFDDAVK
ncbi:MAG: 1-acyl-sn-glycerol-3-phosphate acyltransferase [Bacteroidales bacterium]|nr:1-acyl-sn-glycerol-3-phosphate acyltransferase [Bacteroidales bacterium]MCF0172202.1 1-acyl-sn-glycerol-3-phosphate acyltransferase [Bacteroidales bacterium]